MDALAEIHAVDWRACGLEGYGKPTGYLERQLRRFNGLWEHNKTRELPVVQEVGEWLAENMPESPESTIVHGDYRLGNVMLADDAPARLIAIFDWELSTIGDPLADVGYMTVTWAEPGDPADTLVLPACRAATRRDGLPDPRGADRALRGAHRALDVGAQLVPGARALEGGGVHGGQLQALQAGRVRRRVPGAVRRGRARAGRGGARDRAAREGPARRLRRRPDDERLRLVQGFCENEGLDPDAVKRLFREDPRALASCAPARDRAS